MTSNTKRLCAALLAGVFATATTASFAQTTTTEPTHADKKAAKKQDKADKDAAVAQAKADKKKTESQLEANDAAADASVKDAKKAQ
jgi:hypothetical protein